MHTAGRKNNSHTPYSLIFPIFLHLQWTPSATRLFQVVPVGCAHARRDLAALHGVQLRQEIRAAAEAQELRHEEVPGWRRMAKDGEGLNDHLRKDYVEGTRSG